MKTQDNNTSTIATPVDLAINAANMAFKKELEKYTTMAQQSHSARGPIVQSIEKASQLIHGKDGNSGIATDLRNSNSTEERVNLIYNTLNKEATSPDDTITQQLVEAYLLSFAKKLGSVDRQSKHAISSSTLPPKYKEGSINTTR